MDITDTEGPKLEYISISKMKIKKAISRLKNGASPGPDGVSPELLKNFCVIIKIYSLDIFLGVNMNKPHSVSIWDDGWVSGARQGNLIT